MPRARMRGRGAFHGRYKPDRKDRWWAMEVIMPVRVAIRRVRIPSAVNLRFPVQCKSAQGQPGPKPRPIGVGDGQEANIPPPPLERYGYRQRNELCLWKPLAGPPRIVGPSGLRIRAKAFADKKLSLFAKKNSVISSGVPVP